MKKEIPILFSTPMVQAIIEGRKTMTRRIVKPQPDDDGLWNHDKFPMSLDSDLTGWRGTVDETGESKEFRCPYGFGGKPYLENAILWVRENWKIVAWSFEDGDMTIEYSDNSKLQCDVYDPTEDSMWLVKHVENLVDKDYFRPAKANPKTEEEELLIRTDKKYPFKPSIHMPKEAARIWLEVTGVRVERLNDITTTDAYKEGIREGDGIGSYVPAFIALWDKINGIESWNANPWVWVVSFKVLSTTGKPQEKPQYKTKAEDYDFNSRNNLETSFY